MVAPSRWKLRRAVKKVNQVLAGLQLEKHPDKTFIGKAVRGFSFLGFFLTPWAVSVAQEAVDRMLLRIARLYEQGAGWTGIGRYLRQWIGWCGGVVERMKQVGESVTGSMFSFSHRTCWRVILACSHSVNHRVLVSIIICNKYIPISIITSQKSTFNRLLCNTFYQ